MAGFFRSFTLSALAVVLTGCKLAVIVVEGGEVQSTGSGTCSAGMVCISPVNDTNFTQTYTAVASPGWKFVRWNAGTGFVCPDSTEPDCTISNAGLAGNEAIEALVASESTFYIMPVFEAIETDDPRPEYDPNRTDYDGGISPSMRTRIYWSASDSPPPAPDSNQWFEGSVNRCASSYIGLGESGYYLAAVRRWVNSTTAQECTSTCSDGTPITGPQDVANCHARRETVVEECSTVIVPGRWAPLSAGEHTPSHVECQDDVAFNDPGNGAGQADGFPRDGVLDGEEFSAATALESDVSWGGSPYRLYHANYVDWYNDPSP